MATPRKHTGSGGKKKYGRNRDKCKRYRDLGIRERNKAKRIARCN